MNEKKCTHLHFACRQIQELLSVFGILGMKILKNESETFLNIWNFGYGNFRKNESRTL